MFLNFSPFNRCRVVPPMRLTPSRSGQPLPASHGPTSQDSLTLFPSFSLPHYLKQKQGALWGRCTQPRNFSNLGWETSSEGIRYYLSDRTLKSVCLDLEFEQSYIERWANQCHQMARKIFLRVPSSSEQERSGGFSWYLKRGCDWVAALLLLLLFSPILLVIALLIQLTSPGPIFFRQWRVGQRGQLFRIYKFRTMCIDAAAQHRAVMGQQQGLNKQKHDPRVTPLGRWLRKSSLDELPQLLNVLRGEMSLVGPRPWALYDAVQIRPEDRRRLRALPGITGLWQISGRSQILEINRVTQLDLDYLRNWSLWQDLKILFLTLPSVLLAKGAC